jgi:hypothetical protein
MVHIANVARIALEHSSHVSRPYPEMAVGAVPEVSRVSRRNSLALDTSGSQLGGSSERGRLEKSRRPFSFSIHPSGTLKQTDALHPLLKRPIP